MSPFTRRRAVATTTTTVAFALGALGLAVQATSAPGVRGQEGAPGAAAPAGSVAAPVSRSIVSFRAVDLEGKVHAVGTGRGARVTAVVFLATDCPISNRAIAGLDTLLGTRSRDDLDVLGVLSDPALPRAKAVTHAKEFQVQFPVVLDATGDLARKLAPTNTPEAFLVSRDGTLLYRGRIDDAYLALGKPQAQVKHHDLADAIAAVLSNATPFPARTTPVGCSFEAWAVKQDAPEAVTFARHVAPILYANCAECHHNGAIGPFPLVTFQDAAKRAQTISSVTESRYMPPWHATPEFGHFADERRLSQREIEVLALWAKAGAPQGDAAEAPPVPVFSSDWALGEPDLVIQMPQEFEVPASGPDIYRAFVLDKKIPDDSFVVASEFKPGSASVVHHSLVYLDGSGVARTLEKGAGGNGYPAFGGPHFVPQGSLGGWAPGALPSFLPDGYGRQVKKGQDIVVQMHYHPSGKPVRDRDSIGIYFAKKPVDKVVAWIPLWNENIEIKAGESRYIRHAAVTLPCDVTVIAAVPHMHLIGREMKVEATDPDGKKIPLIWVQDWDFRWQGQYTYANPFRLKAGTRLTMEARYDNSPANPQNPSDPPREVDFGEQTTDEMCLCFVTIAYDHPDDRRKMQQALGREPQEPARPKKEFH